mmetsp:Transcript_13186/g.17183  ORF Transcript_13186/g.17183 Transcript_13186/m.17183 type:complete len:376 (+) Transcript_13186:363-1490(+)
MGLCNSSGRGDEALRNKTIERRNKHDAEARKRKIKLLLLGSGESGKSTIFRQMRFLYGDRYNEAARKEQTANVYSSIILNMQILIRKCSSHTNLLPESQAVATEILNLQVGENARIDAAVGAKLKQIWNDPGAQATWKARAEFQIQDALKYYCSVLDRISAEDYVPEVADILRIRIRTTGIVEETYTIDGIQFAMFDVGGQRNERRKWIHCFENVTAIIFVAAINEYNQVLYEDNTTSRMEEAINLFDEICNSKWFKNTAMILFLNKKDLFREKLGEFPFRVTDGMDNRFDDFEGPHCIPGTNSAIPGTKEFEACYEAAVTYCRTLFTARNTQPKEIYYHTTCATDTNNVKVVFYSCKNIILKSSLRGTGLIEKV